MIRTAITRRARHVLVLATLGAPWLPSGASAQTIGIFRWQTQPFCNVLTLAITASGSAYRLEGTDDQCGAATKASAIGMAFPNADGSIGVGLTIVSPGAAVLHLDATLQINTGFSGAWHDTVGRSGTWLFTPNAGVGGPVRPVVGPLIPFGSVVTQSAGGSDRGLSVTVASDTGTPNDAAGLYGRFGAAIAPLESAAPAGVRGDSGANVGVYGLSATGFGVAGGAQTGVGVQGYAVEGAGSIGVQAVHSAGGTALEINNGFLKVAGAIRTAFVYTATTTGSCEPMNSAALNGDANALVFVSARTPAIGLTTVYDGQRWIVCSTTSGLTLFVGMQVSVLVIKQ